MALWCYLYCIRATTETNITASTYWILIINVYSKHTKVPLSKLEFFFKLNCPYLQICKASHKLYLRTTYLHLNHSILSIINFPCNHSIVHHWIKLFVYFFKVVLFRQPLSCKLVVLIDKIFNLVFKAWSYWGITCSGLCLECLIWRPYLAAFSSSKSHLLSLYHQIIIWTVASLFHN